MKQNIRMFVLMLIYALVSWHNQCLLATADVQHLLYIENNSNIWKECFHF